MKIDLHNVFLSLAVLILLYVSIIGSITLDLWAGLRRAKQRGKFIKSYLLRRTYIKSASYFNVVLALTLMDCVLNLGLFYFSNSYKFNVYIFPYFTFIGSMGVVFIEFKSILEKNESKKDIKDLVQEIKDNLPDGKAKDIAELINGLLK